MHSLFHILTVTHKELPLADLPAYAIAADSKDDLDKELHQIKEDLGLEELFYLSTCNRILFLYVADLSPSREVLHRFFSNAVDHERICHFSGAEAILHLFQVASSIHSLVIGEREILKQLRDSYEVQSHTNLTGDYIRLAIEHCIRSAKKVYSGTKIGERPVSVVSLAVQKLLRSFKIRSDANFLVVGAGSTVELLLKHLTKKGYQNFSIYNRTATRAKVLMQGLHGTSGDLTALKQHQSKVDVVVACTGSQTPIITMELMQSMVGANLDDIVWLDLGVPTDVDTKICEHYAEKFIGVETLQQEAQNNMQFRMSEVHKAEMLLDEAVHEFQQLVYRRRIERAFRSIPTEIKQIKQRAVEEVFRKDLEMLDDQTQDLMHKMLNYMEKKCISVPMKAAKKVVM